MKLIFEKSCPGREQSILWPCDVPELVPDVPMRERAPRLPEISENEMGRHYTALAKRAHGVNDGFYPLGSCTMKHNPKINEAAAALPGFRNVHPLAPEESVQGCLEAIGLLENYLCALTGMDAMTMQPAAGAHGEFTGLLLIKAYHASKNDCRRTKMLIPDSAHGTNPASAAMAGYEVVNIPSTPDGCVDLEALRLAAGEDTAGLMLTNPNTVGLFDKNIEAITQIVHDAGGLCYYDGANLNAIMGIVRPGDMGFDVIHLNLHKTFSTPHGGGGPGSGPVGCKEFLAGFLPGLCVKQNQGQEKPSGSGEAQGFSLVRAEKSIGDVRLFHGNFLVAVKALSYILTLGREGLKAAAQNAVLNANYLMEHLKEMFPCPFEGPCMHEFVVSLEGMKHENGVNAMDIAKALLDYGIHPPTMYFPLIVAEALMIEPTETESRETLDEVIEIFKKVYALAKAAPKEMHHMPKRAQISRPDEVRAARKPVLKYDFKA